MKGYIKNLIDIEDAIEKNNMYKNDFNDDIIKSMQDIK